MNLIRSSAATGLLRACSLATSMVLSIVLARVLGSSEFGRYSLITSIVLLLAVPVQMGLPVLILRESSIAKAKLEWARLKDLWRYGNFIAIVMSLIVIVITYAVYHMMPLADSYAYPLYWGLLSLPFLALLSQRCAALRALGYVLHGQLPETVLRTAVFLLIVLCFWLGAGKSSLKAEHALSAFTISSALAFLYALLLLKAKTPREVFSVTSNEGINARRAVRWMLASFPLGLIAALQVVNGNIDVVMLGYFEPPDEVGSYRVASAAALLIVFGLQAINIVVAPRFASMYSQERWLDLQQLVTSSARLGFVSAAAFYILLILLGEPVIRFAYGDAYSNAYMPLMILGLGQLFNAAAGPSVLLMNMARKEKFVLISTASAIAINVALNVVLIPLWGITGAAASTAASIVTWNAVLTWFTWKRIGVNPSVIRLGMRHELA